MAGHDGLYVHLEDTDGRRILATRQTEETSSRYKLTTSRIHLERGNSIAFVLSFDKSWRQFTEDGIMVGIVIGGRSLDGIPENHFQYWYFDMRYSAIRGEHRFSSFSIWDRNALVDAPLERPFTAPEPRGRTPNAFRMAEDGHACVMTMTIHRVKLYPFQPEATKLWTETVPPEHLWPFGPYTSMSALQEYSQMFREGKCIVINNEWVKRLQGINGRPFIYAFKNMGTNPNARATIATQEESLDHNDASNKLQKKGFVLENDTEDSTDDSDGSEGDSTTDGSHTSGDESYHPEFEERPQTLKRSNQAAIASSSSGSDSEQDGCSSKSKKARISHSEGRMSDSEELISWNDIGTKSTSMEPKTGDQQPDGSISETAQIEPLGSVLLPSGILPKLGTKETRVGDLASAVRGEDIAAGGSEEDQNAAKLVRRSQRLRHQVPFDKRWHQHCKRPSRAASKRKKRKKAATTTKVASTSHMGQGNSEVTVHIPSYSSKPVNSDRKPVRRDGDLDDETRMSGTIQSQINRAQSSTANRPTQHVQDTPQPFTDLMGDDNGKEAVTNTENARITSKNQDSDVVFVKTEPLMIPAPGPRNRHSVTHGEQKKKDLRLQIKNIELEQQKLELERQLLAMDEQD